MDIVKRYYFLEDVKDEFFRQLMIHALHYCQTASWMVSQTSLERDIIRDQMNFLDLFSNHFIKHYSWKELGHLRITDGNQKVPSEFGLYQFQYTKDFLSKLIQFQPLPFQSLYQKMYNHNQTISSTKKNLSHNYCVAPWDLNLYRTQDLNSVWLHSTTHEQQAALHLTQTEKLDLVNRFPALYKKISDNPPFKIWG